MEHMLEEFGQKNNGPSVVKIINNEIYDITTKEIPTVSSLLELENPIDYIKQNFSKYL